MKKIALSLLFIALLLTGCKEETSNNTNRTIDVQAALSKEKFLNYSEIFSHPEYIKLETNTECLIAEVSKIIPIDDKILIVDTKSQKVLLFNNDGTFLYSIGNRGEGAGEYAKISDATIDEESQRIFILDNAAHKTHIYTIDNTFIESKKNNFIAHKLEYLSNNTLAYDCDFTFNQGYIKENQHPNLLLVNLNNMATQSFLYIPTEIQAEEIISSPTLSATGKGEAIAFDILTNSIYKIDAKGISENYILSFGNSDTSRRKDHVQRLIDEHLPTIDFHTGDRTPPNYAQITLCIACENKLLITAVNYSNSTVYAIYYSLETGNYLWGRNTDSQIPLHNDIDGGVFFMPYASKDNAIYGCIEAYTLKNIEDINCVTSKQLKEIIEQTNEDDNPIIVIAATKDI